MSSGHPDLDPAWWPDALPRPEGTLLHTPCGEGHWLVARSSAHTRIGADPIQQNLERARAWAAQQAAPCAFVPALGTDLPFADASFDLVVDSASLQTAPDPLDALVELLRLVAWGGRLLLVWGPSPPQRSALQYPTLRDVDAHTVETMLESLGAQLEDSGQDHGLCWLTARR